MSFLRISDLLKIVRTMFVAIACAFILNTMPARADIPAGYTQITSSDTTKYPSVLTGYTKYTITGDITWGEVGTNKYYRYQIDSKNIVGTGAQISNMFNGVAISSNNTYVGFSFYYSSTALKTYIGVRDSSKFTSAESARAYFNEHPLVILVKTTTATDNVYQLVKRNSDGVIGYYCTVGTNVGDFVPAFGATEDTTIKIATTKYNEAEFAPVETDLNAARTVINNLITQMQTNAINVSKLAVEKQTRPNVDCPAGKNCLLVTDPNGAENWYEIVGADAVQSSSNVPDYFSFTTTALNAGDSVGFSLTPSGTFTVDWGDGSTPQVIERTNTTSETYSHSYSNAGAKTVKITGRANGYSTDQDTGVLSFVDTSQIASIDGCLGAIFPTLGANDGQQPSFFRTFRRTKITSIPEHLFDGVTGAGDSMFGQTFSRTQITSIPAGLFSGVTGAAEGMFDNTFDNTQITSIPENLFSGVTGAADYMFNKTFSGTQITSIPENLFSGVSGSAKAMFGQTFSNTKITSIPENLFSGVTGVADNMFNKTFSGTQITSIPAGLFSGVTGAAQGLFYKTFYNCPNLSGYIPESSFAGLIENNSPDAEIFMYDIFDSSTGLATACPQNMTEVQTPYKSKYWSTGNGNAVMCRPN